MEHDVRKLLVASQKGGVGKTTTSINVAAATALAGARVLLLDTDPLSSISASLNLASHPRRQLLREVGVNLPGVLVANVLPGLDVLCPYEDGGCSDDDLDQLLALLETPAFQESYGCLIVNTPPFLGANPAQLLAAADEFIIVMRAEPLASRTLPAFLELVQRARPAGISLRGILLTLPETQEPAGRWERELRGRFGTRILATVIPHDEAVMQAGLFGQIVADVNKESPAATAYRALVENLALAAGVPDASERPTGAQALMLASAALAGTARQAAPRGLPTTRTPFTAPVPAPEKAEVPPPASRQEPERPSPSRRRQAPVYLEPVDLPAEEEPAPAPLQPAAGPKGDTTTTAGLLWVGLAMIVGVGLRFMRLPDFMVPVLVGVGVGSVVILVLRHFLMQPGPSDPPAPTRKPTSRRTDGRPETGKRLSGLKRRLARKAREL
jgi:chromosome partitioning protein